MKGFLQFDGAVLRGSLVDAFGMVTDLEAVPTLIAGKPGYAVTARLASVPEDLSVPGDADYGIEIR